MNTCIGVLSITMNSQNSTLWTFRTVTLVNLIDIISNSLNPSIDNHMFMRTCEQLTAEWKMEDCTLELDKNATQTKINFEAKLKELKWE
jgi:hypothetical protein